MRSVLRALGLVAASSIATAALVSACARETTTEQPSPTRVAEIAAAQSATSVATPAVTVYQRNAASVVNITSIGLITSRGAPTQVPQGIGSGFMLDADGRIVTNNHVVQDASQLAVTFSDATIVAARLVGRDADNDLAVIQVDPSDTDDSGRPIQDRLKPVGLADSDQVMIGEVAIAIGSPLGLQQTVTQGIVSARRDPEGAGESIDLLGGAIQSDAAINPGNSGGPLFNAAGQVIGVNTAILSQSGGNEGIGFAIPINVVKRVAPELIQNGRYRHPYVGIASLPLAQVGQAVRQQLGVPANQSGILVLEATGRAADAGIRGGNRLVSIGNQQVPTGGEIVVAVDGRPLSSGGDLRAYIENSKRPGDTVTLTVVRNGQHQDVTVTLAERPQQT